MKSFLVALAALAAVSLTSRAEARDFPGHIVYMPNGSTAYAISCDGPFEDMQTCYKRAGEICLATGYHVVSEQPEAADLPEPIAQFKRRMMIRCRTPDGLFPADRGRSPE